MIRKLLLPVLILLASSVAAEAQSVRNPITRPWPRYGSTLPLTCAPGDIFRLAPLWKQFDCTAPDTWTSDGGLIPNPYPVGQEFPQAVKLSGPVTIAGPVNQVLSAGQDNSCWVMGDSTAISTPYPSVPEAGLAWSLSTRFALDPTYTIPSGVESSLTSWSTLRNAAYDSGTKTLTLTTCNGGGCPVNFGIWKADAYQDAISLSEFPTSRYRVSFEYDTSGIKNPDVTDNSVNNFSPGSDTVDYLQVYLRLSGTCPTWGNLDADWFNGTAPIIAFRRAPWTKAGFILDPTSFGSMGRNVSADLATGDCKLEPGFIAVSNYSGAAVVIKVRNFSLQRVTRSTSVRLYGAGGQIQEGVELDDYPVVKTRFLTGKTFPMNCIVNVVGQNSYDGQGAVDGSPSSSTVESFFSSISTFATTLETDGVTTRLFVPPWQRKTAADTAPGPWAPNQTTAKSEGWRTFQVSLRRFFQQQIGWKWIDPARWWQWDDRFKPQVLGIPGSALPGAGASQTYPVTIQIDAEHGFAYTVQLVSDTTVPQSDTNYYCFRPKNASTGNYLTAKKKCTRSTGTGTEDAGDLSALSIRLLSPEQNVDVSPNNILVVEINRVGTPTVPGYIMVQYILSNSAHSENPFMDDGQHPSQLGYAVTSDAIWEYLSGRPADGFR